MIRWNGLNRLGAGPVWDAEGKVNHNGDTWYAVLSGGIVVGAVQTVGPGSLEFRTLWTSTALELIAWRWEKGTICSEPSVSSDTGAHSPADQGYSAHGVDAALATENL